MNLNSPTESGYSHQDSSFKVLKEHNSHDTSDFESLFVGICLREQEVDKEREEEISEGEGEKGDEDTSDGEEVDKGRDAKKGRARSKFRE